MQGKKPPSPETFIAGRDALENLEPLKQLFTWIGQHIHANRISAARLLGGAAAIATHTVSPVAGTAAYLVNTAGDWVDGAVARNAGQRTKEGAILDPLVDKIVTGMTLWYIAAVHSNDNLPFLAAVGVSTLTDFIVQRMRGPFRSQLHDALKAALHPTLCEAIPPGENIQKIEATTLGKIKFILQSLAVTALLSLPGNDTVENIFAAGSLGVCVGLGANSLVKRIRQSKKPRA
ncbi:MAG: hypothetical protein Greene101449_589 [Candidatus Peregrinibacteria bacterium Greene1014_49]|nr:MAG: hypothetical protein Greene101449_589 [Candidatus Peregrinibacteria bacterium Greene1014_49]